MLSRRDFWGLQGGGGTKVPARSISTEPPLFWCIPMKLLQVDGYFPYYKF